MKLLCSFFGHKTEYEKNITSEDSTIPDDIYFICKRCGYGKLVWYSYEYIKGWFTTRGWVANSSEINNQRNK